MKEINYSLSKTDTNVIKGIAVCLLLFHHLFYSQDTFTNYEITGMFFSNLSIHTLGLFCKTCLCLFVFVSGYGLTITYKKKETKMDVKKDVSKRIFHLFLQYWFVFAIANIISLILPSIITNGVDTVTIYFSEGVVKGIIYILLDALCLSRLLGTPIFNVTWWWMPVAIVIFLLVPIIYNWSKKYGFVLYICSIYIIKLTGIDTQSTCVYLLPTLVLGCWCAETDFFNKFIKKFNFLFLLNLLAFLFLYILYRARTEVPASIFWDGLFPIPVSIIVILFIRKLRGFRYILMKLGEISLYMFLTHTFIKTYWFAEYIYQFKYPLLIFLSLLASTYVSSLALSKCFTFISDKLYFKKN